MNLIFTKKANFFAFILLAQSMFAFDCNLPDGCFIQPIKYAINELTNEKNIFDHVVRAIKCKVVRGYQFRFVNNDYMVNNSNRCVINNQNWKWESEWESIWESEELEVIMFEWPENGEHMILEKSFDVQNMSMYFDYFRWFFEIYFVKLKGIDINLSKSDISIIRNVSSIICKACKLNFYTERKLIKSCEDILKSNSRVMSIHQIYKLESFILENNEYPTYICPLIFKNVNIVSLHLTGLIDSFYKKNVLLFTNNTFSNLNSTISILLLVKVENIHLDLNILNPSVFKELAYINAIGSLKSIDKRIFTTFNNLSEINLHSTYFRKLAHENGIDWIKEINKNQTKVDLRNITAIKDKELIIKNINIKCSNYLQKEPIFKVFLKIFVSMKISHSIDL